MCILSGPGGGAPGPGVSVPGGSGSRSGSAVQTESGQAASHPEVDPHAEEAVESPDWRGAGTPQQTAGRRSHKTGSQGSTNWQRKRNETGRKRSISEINLAASFSFTVMMSQVGLFTIQPGVSLGLGQHSSLLSLCLVLCRCCGGQLLAEWQETAADQRGSWKGWVQHSSVAAAPPAAREGDGGLHLRD